MKLNGILNDFYISGVITPRIKAIPEYSHYPAENKQPIMFLVYESLGGVMANEKPKIDVEHWENGKICPFNDYGCGFNVVNHCIEQSFNDSGYCVYDHEQDQQAEAVIYKEKQSQQSLF
jgi:hypothetical protein